MSHFFNVKLVYDNLFPAVKLFVDMGLGFAGILGGGVAGVM
jgi:hypothetical protein